MMPGGIPVATVAVGKPGATNAAWLAAQIMALSNSDLAARIGKERQSSADGVVAKDGKLQAEL
jgi:5-(carboxyamino)imidazole ribonucleotide mutase